jgi:hypothetical protein
MAETTYEAIVVEEITLDASMINDAGLVRINPANATGPAMTALLSAGSTGGDLEGYLVLGGSCEDANGNLQVFDLMQRIPQLVSATVDGSRLAKLRYVGLGLAGRLGGGMVLDTTVQHGWMWAEVTGMPWIAGATARLVVLAFHAARPDPVGGGGH